jgi:hypothetical protein
MKYENKTQPSENPVTKVGCKIGEDKLDREDFLVTARARTEELGDKGAVEYNLFSELELREIFSTRLSVRPPYV